MRHFSPKTWSNPDLIFKSKGSLFLKNKPYFVFKRIDLTWVRDAEAINVYFKLRHSNSNWSLIWFINNLYYKIQKIDLFLVY